MKLNDIYKMSLALVGSLPGNNDYMPLALSWFNLLLQEALPYENSLRQAAGQAALSQAPTVSGWDDEINYCPEITRSALPYGLAALMYQEDDRESLAQYYRAIYVSALKESSKVKIGLIEDVYGGEAHG